MKTAILLASNKADKRATEPRVLLIGPYNVVADEFKRRCRTGEGEPGYDSLEVWTGPPAKRRSKFDPDTTFPGAPSPEAEGADPQGSDQLPENASAGTGEGDLPGAEATEPESTELEAPGPETSETASASPGSLTPKGKGKK